MGADCIVQFGIWNSSFWIRIVGNKPVSEWAAAHEVLNCLLPYVCWYIFHFYKLYIIWLTLIFYFLEIYWFDKVFENTLNTIIFGISLPICGAFVWLYRTFFIRFKKLKTFLKIQRKDPDYVEHLKTERESILQTLKEAQNLYSLQAEK